MVFSRRLSVVGRQSSVVRHPSAVERRWRLLQERIEKELDAEVVAGAAEVDRGELAAAESLVVELLAGMVQQLDLFAELAVGALIRQRFQRRIVDSAYLNRSDVAAVLSGFEPMDLLREAVIDAYEGLAHSQRPVHRIAGDSEKLLDLSQQLQRLAPRPVHLVVK